MTCTPRGLPTLTIALWCCAAAQARQLDETRFPAAVKEAHESAGWHCPKCRAAYTRPQLPERYLCFCNKLADPPFDPWLAPHTCGERCEKPLARCAHACRLLCHPGPCPPCPCVVQVNHQYLPSKCTY